MMPNDQDSHELENMTSQNHGVGSSPLENAERDYYEIDINMIRQKLSEKFDSGSKFFKYKLRRFLMWFRRQFLFKLIILSFCIVLMVSIFHPVGKQTVKQAGYIYYSILRSHTEVKNKSDLSKVDVSQLLRFKSWADSPLTNTTISQKYKKEALLGYVSNLDLAKHQKIQDKDDNAKTKENDRLLKWESEYHHDYDNMVDCSDLAYKGTIEHSEWTKILEDDLIEARRELISRNDMISKVIVDDAEKNWSEEEIVRRRWFRFGATPIWLEEEQCYVVYSRVTYSKRDQRNHPKLSLLRGQAFDKDWNELKGKMIPYNDVSIPSDMDAQIRKLDQELGVDNCEKYKKSSPAQYDACHVEQTKNHLKAKKRKEAILSKYYVTYPTTFAIPFNTDGEYKGPEDPKAILKRSVTPNGVKEEPLTFFNMHDSVDNKRRMFAFWPHKKNDPLLKFTSQSFNMKDKEKNWTPFFHRGMTESTLSRGFVHFIYTFIPLEVLKCSLNDGVCEKVFEASTLELSKDTKFDNMRGGTAYIPLPDILPQVAGKNMWVGFAKLHVRNCGCGNRFYRPMLSLLVESNGVYHQEVVVPSVDFDSEVLSWDLKGTYCFDINVLSPNSIAYWEVVDQDPETKKFEDYMALALSEADSMTRVINVKGVLNYILGIYDKKAMKEEFEVSKQSDYIISRTLKCLVNDSKEACKAYGETHKEPEKLKNN